MYLREDYEDGHEICTTSNSPAFAVHGPLTVIRQFLSWIMPLTAT